MSRFSLSMWRWRSMVSNFIIAGLLLIVVDASAQTGRPQYNWRPKGHFPYSQPNTTPNTIPRQGSNNQSNRTISPYGYGYSPRYGYGNSTNPYGYYNNGFEGYNFPNNYNYGYGINPNYYNGYSDYNNYGNYNGYNNYGGHNGYNNHGGYGGYPYNYNSSYNPNRYEYRDRSNPVIEDSGRQVTGVTIDPRSGQTTVNTQRQIVQQSATDPQRHLIDPGSWQVVNQQVRGADGTLYLEQGYRWTSNGVPHSNIRRTRIRSTGIPGVNQRDDTYITNQVQPSR